MRATTLAFPLMVELVEADALVRREDAPHVQQHQGAGLVEPGAQGLDQVRPHEIVLQAIQDQAFELAARVTRVDLDDSGEGVDGGSMTDVTVGANWYLNPNSRVMVNLVRAAIDEVDGAVYAAVTRFAVDF